MGISPSLSGAAVQSRMFRETRVRSPTSEHQVLFLKGFQASATHFMRFFLCLSGLDIKNKPRNTTAPYTSASSSADEHEHLFPNAMQIQLR